MLFVASEVAVALWVVLDMVCYYLSRVAAHSPGSTV